MKPHKCPSCGGWGKRFDYPPILRTGPMNGVLPVQTDSQEGFHCISCDGKGILWAPDTVTLELDPEPEEINN